MDGHQSFRKAVKHGAKLRFAVSGPSGSGKTYTLLKLATELGGPVALIDTEHGSASKYADIFEFDVLELDSYDPLRLIEIIDQAAKEQYKVLCIDSLSHFWVGKDGELDKVDRAARRMQSPNSFAAWKQVTPIHNALIDKIIGAPLHVLVSMRSKTEWMVPNWLRLPGCQSAGDTVENPSDLSCVQAGAFGVDSGSCRMISGPRTGHSG